MRLKTSRFFCCPDIIAAPRHSCESKNPARQGRPPDQVRSRIYEPPARQGINVVRNKADAARGFTLLEVLAALAVATFALAALWKALSQGIIVTEGLPDRVLARWVAHNRIVLRQATGQWPETRAYTGSEEMAGRTWRWEEQVRATNEPRLRRLTVKVGKDPEAPPLITLEGFIRRPQQP